MEKFRGDFAELETRVATLGYVGEWSEDNGKRIFKSEDGAILNWWPSTGTMNVQGPRPARTKLEAILSGSLEGSPPANADVGSNASDTPSAVKQKSDDPTLSSSSEESTRVFVVYGHDVVACEQLELVLHRLDLDPFVLGNTSGGGLTIIEALEQEIVSPSKGKRFGIVLLTPDDMGFKQGDDTATAEPRARQNVIMEMGMLIAAFGRPRVAILKKGHVEVPSDASGIIYLSFSNHVKEAAPKLCQQLREAGFELNPDSIAKASA